MNLVFNPPSIWLTINPSEADPIVQIFCGSKIDLEAFIKTAGPTAGQRSRNVAGDPYAATRYFYFIIETVIETLFGIQSKRENKIK